MRRRLQRGRNPLFSSERHVDVCPRGMTAKKSAFFASYGESHLPSRSVVELTRELTLNGYDVVLLRASPSGVHLEWPEEELSIRPTIVSRENVGYDFGSWAIGIHDFPRLARREHVLLVNDSMVGPFGGIAELLRKFETSTADVWGATSTLQFEPHLQSYFFGFRGGILGKYPLKRFWSSVRELGSKEQIIVDYERGLSRLFTVEMLTTDAFLRAEELVLGEMNPAIDAWDTMLERGFPFVKRELLRREQFSVERERIVEAVREKYSTDPMEWFESV